MAPGARTWRSSSNTNSARRSGPACYFAAPRPMTLTVQPLTAEHWPALEAVLGPDGARGCWCMYWRIGRGYRDRTRAKNRADFQAIVEHGPPPGALIAFDGAAPVGWCQVGPRAALPGLAHAWRLAPIDEAPVWALSCLYVRKGYRRRGDQRRPDRGGAGRLQRRPAERRRRRPIRSTPSCRRAPPEPAMRQTSPSWASSRSPAASPPARSCASI